MDRFKFRVWNGDMYTQEFFLPNISNELQSDNCGGLMDKNAVSCLWDDMLTTDAVIEQCTGLKDRNGKLIYEGDKINNMIVTWCGDTEEGLGMSVGWYLQEDDFESWLELEAHNEHEVIGNIHEVNNG